MTRPSSPHPWETFDGHCKVCDAPPAAIHKDDCWLSLSLLWMREKCAEQQVSEPASGAEVPYQVSPHQAAQSAFDLVTTLTEHGYGVDVTVELPGGNSLALRGYPIEKGSHDA